MRQKNRRRSLLTLYHHKRVDERVYHTDEPNQYVKHNHLLHSDKSAYNTYFYKYKSKLHKLVSLRLSPQNLTHISIPLLVSGFGLLLVLGLSVGCVGGNSNNIVYAEGENETVALSDNASVSLSLADTANNGNMTITGENKSIQEQVNTTNNTGYIAVDFHVTATNIDKYDVYVQSSNSALIGETNKGKVESISSDTTYANMVNNPGWGYAVAEGSNVNAETLTYKPIQTSASSAVDSGSAANTTVNKDYTLAFAANLTGATADHYKSNITLSVAAGATQVMTLYSVTYNTNGSTAGVTPPTQTAESNSSTYSFATPKQNDLAREGYVFIGWSENPAANTAQYIAGSQIELASSLPNKILYAVWVNLNSIDAMQDMSPAICQIANIGDSRTLTDIRDGISYTVGKLSDGKCWMTQNLRIVNKKITSADSDVTSNYVIPASSDPWKDTSATTNKVYYADNTAYGAYYTWYTATAGTGTASVTSGDATGSICPKGWRLPAKEEFAALADNGNSSWTSNNNVDGYWFGGTSPTASGVAFFPAGGGVFDGLLNDANSEGRYWSSAALNSSQAYYLNFVSSRVSVYINANRYRGVSVRCVAR